MSVLRKGILILAGAGILWIGSDLLRGGEPAARARPSLSEPSLAAPSAERQRTPSSAPVATGPEAPPAEPEVPPRVLTVTNESDAARRSEGEWMDELRGVDLFADPATALRLAREGNERFPQSAGTPERNWYEARALVELQRFDEAVRVARAMVERHPTAEWTADVQRHLLTHPLGESPVAR